MNFSEAFALMKRGEKVKLPSSQADMLAEDWIFAD